MYYYLTQSLKRRLILELKDSFGQHPIYDKIVPFIQNKYAFDERPQFGIVVKGSSANKVALSADNFMGTVESYVMLAYVGQPAYPLEWVREDLACVRENDGRMPTAPGIYYIEILTVPTTAQDLGTFVVDPLLSVIDEPVLQFVSGIEREAQLQQVPVRGTLRLWQNRNYELKEGVDYTVDYTPESGGAVRFLTRFTPNSIVTADYFYPAPSFGPVPFQWNTADFKTLHGVVLAFGKRAKVGDKVAVRVYSKRVEAARAFGGRFDATFEFDVIAQDPIQMEEIADLSIMYLWAQKRPFLSTEGIEITDVSMGGETEEVYDETADLYYYNATMSIQIQSDWELHVPLPLTVSRVSATTPATDLDPTHGQSTIVGTTQNKLFYATAPILVGRNNAFERIT
jgi:hypothetical protein